MSGHRAGVAQAEVDVLDPVDVDEARALRLSHENREAAGPIAHPVHRHALEERRACTLRELAGAWMGLDEPRLLARVQLSEAVHAPSSAACPCEVTTTVAVDPFRTISISCSSSASSHTECWGQF